MRKVDKKIIAGFELTLMMVSLFAFAHGVSLSDGFFDELDEEYGEMKNLRAEKIVELGGNIGVGNSKMGVLIDIFWKKLRDPMIPVVSAAIEDEAGCCFISKDGQKCGTASSENCADGSSFAEGALCASTSFCRKGCCFDESAGIYDKNVLKNDCSVEWVGDPNCNMPEAKLGCCVLGSTSSFETLGQCKVRTLVFAEGSNSVVDWSSDLNEGQCMVLSATQNEGACVVAGGCKFVSEVECYNYDGDFNEGYLCSSSSLDTPCGMTEQTTCVDGKDGVYFVDSCGNVANIYDSARVDDVEYWDKIVPPVELCGDEDVEGGNADSASCGNCNRFLGGICGSALEDSFDVDVGNFYCKDTSCLFDGVKYRNGESWCVYDGKIGDGDDVVGSRHWKYVCSQGVTQIEPCADYRNQICVQSNTFDVDGNDVEFRNAACVANNWRECLALNSEEDGMKKCEDTLNCRIETMDAADNFKFDFCAPKYPGGFSLNDERYQKTAQSICGMASQTCEVVYAPKTWGGCKIVANKGCLSDKFAEEMNDVCRRLGDCGGEVNILGVYSENFKVKRSPGLSGDWINKLKKLAEPVDGQFAEVENYSKFLETAGIWANPGEAPEAGEAGEIFDSTMVGVGVAGIGYAAGAYALGTYAVTVSSLEFMSLGGSSLAGFAGVAIGAGIGMVVGGMLAKSMGLSPGGSMLMSIGGAMVGGGIMAAYTVLASVPLVGWAIAIIGAVIMLISSLFGGSDCDNVDVEFVCKPWQPPRGGDDCDECNGDPLKPCSVYRCNSLGASCEIINKGTEDEICIDGRANDTTPPILRPQLEVVSEGSKYGDISDDGFEITAINGDCIDAYTNIVFGIVTNEPAQCKFDVEMKDFGEMDFDVGGNAYVFEHTTSFSLPDPSHGQSQGANWTGDLSLYVKCVDTKGHESPGFYVVDMCVKEGPDRMAPIIRAVSPDNDKLIRFNTTSEDVSIVTNEVASCRWDFADVDYSLMENLMSCEDTLDSPSHVAGYVCKDVFPTESSDNVYYVRCMDQPWVNNSEERNANAESFVYKLRKPEKMIEIDWVEPSQDFEINTDMTTIELEVRTSGGSEWHHCSYSFSGYEDMIEMFETGADRLHSQVLNRPVGVHKIYVECSDDTGDSVQSVTEFEIFRDTSIPQIARVWQSGGNLYIITTENAECRYSMVGCGFNWEDGELAGTGEEHTISAIRGKTYYVKCEDENGNAPSGCSIEARILQVDIL